MSDITLAITLGTVLGICIGFVITFYLWGSDDFVIVPKPKKK